jgi:hypothetical protein
MVLNISTIDVKMISIMKLILFGKAILYFNLNFPPSIN